MLLFVLALIAAGAVGFWGYNYLTRDLPTMDNISDYHPPAVSSLYSNDGTLVAEFYEERRYPAKIAEIPMILRQAFLAAEDANFYQHKGIDPLSILRAVVKNAMAGSTVQGASTITQQVVKNLLLTPERKIERKLKEAILSYRIEKKLSKDEILEIYLNQIFFGNNAYGIKAAVQLYFKKKLSEITLGEAAMLAGLPKAPSRYSPLLHLDRAKRRQRYVLGQMVKVGFITQEDADEAEREKIRFYTSSMQNIYSAPYYVAEARKVFAEKWRELDIDRDGLQVYTSLDLTADRVATAGLQKGLREIDKRRGWRGPLTSIVNHDQAEFKSRFGAQLPETLEPNTVYPALVMEVQRSSGVAKISFGEGDATVNLKEATWAKKKLGKEDVVSWIEPAEVMRPGDVIEVSLKPVAAKTEDGQESEKPYEGFVLDQTPEIEGSAVLIQPDSGKVLTTIGGYSYQRSVFNRATQGLRQPGSAFKPIVYLSAVDFNKYTPATIVYDTPRTFRVGDQFWTPANYDEKFLGGITLRVALEKSRNLVSADIVSKIGVDVVIRYAKKLGLTSPLGRNLSLALGSSEVTNLELTRAYGVFAARGALFDSVFITKIVDRDGKVLYDYENERFSNGSQVIDEKSAFLMANMMKGVIESGTGTRIKAIGRPVAGKTGTSNDQMDAWFIGYTPQWVCGIWVGFDQKKEIGNKETGGVVAAPIWLYIMSDFLKYEDEIGYARLVEEAKSRADKLGIEYVEPEPLTALDFSPPEGVDPVWIDKTTGRPAQPEAPGAIYEYFIRGSEPQRSSQSFDSATFDPVAPPPEEEASSYLESPDL